MRSGWQRSYAVGRDDSARDLIVRWRFHVRGGRGRWLASEFGKAPVSVRRPSKGRWPASAFDGLACRLLVWVMRLWCALRGLGARGRHFRASRRRRSRASGPAALERPGRTAFVREAKTGPRQYATTSWSAGISGPAVARSSSTGFERAPSMWPAANSLLRGTHADEQRQFAAAEPLRRALAAIRLEVVTE